MNQYEQIQQQSTTDDEISLIDLFAVLLKHKALIIITTLLGMIGVLVFCILSLVLPPETSPLPNKYTPVAHMLINDSSSSGGGLSSMINSSGLGGLASLAGVSTGGGSTYSSLAVYLAGTNSFLDSIVDEFALIERYEIEKSPRANSRRALKEVLSASFDEDSSVFSISFTDIDPVFAQSVVNYAVDYIEKRFTELNLDKNKLEKENLEANIASSYNEIVNLQKEIQKIESSVANAYSAVAVPSIMLDTSMKKLELEAQQTVYTQLKTQYELLKITMESEAPIFQVLEKAEVPDLKSGPSRGMLCIIVTFASFFIAVFLAFVINAIENIKQDEEAMAKLRVVKKIKGKK
jgi:uncharacterized protein involved in exopolysaccharide biosynthesis